MQGIYTGKLDNAGERLAITNRLGATVLSVTYGDAAPWPAAADGEGFSLVPVNQVAPFDPDDPANWRASAVSLGSPGATDVPAAVPGVVISEVLSHATAPAVDAVELHNPTPEEADIGGWFLTDDRTAPKKYRIGDGTTLPAGGYLVFDETDFNVAPGTSNSFAFSALGEQVYLFSGDASTNLTGYSHGFSFGGSALDVSFGRYLNSTGEELFPATAALTFGAANADPRVGPVVINEIMYHPTSGQDEFVELKNISSEAVPLYDPAYPTNVWRINGLAFSFPQGLSIPAHGLVVVASTNPAAFRSHYDVPPEAQVFGPFGGTLQNSGEKLELLRPGTPQTNGVPWITLDEVRYNDKAPWPVAADGDGPSLQRLVPAAYGNDPTNWFASGPTPGLDNAYNVPPSVVLTNPAEGTVFAGPAAINLQVAVADDDGSVAQVEFFADGVKLGESTSAPFDLPWTAAPGSYTLTARATDNGLASAISGPVTVTVNPPPPAGGLGLKAEYYDNLDFTGTLVTRTNSTVNFDWGTGAPCHGHWGRLVFGPLERHGPAALFGCLHLHHLHR